MSQLPAMPVWWADFFNKTDHLSNEEQWAYMKLLAKTWARNAQPIPDKAPDIARALGMTVKRWLKIRPRIVPFFDLSAGTWRQKNLEKQFAFVAERVEISRRNGKRGGRPLSNKNNDVENPEVFQQEPVANPEQTRNETTHTQKESKIPEASASGAFPSRDRTKEVFDKGLAIVGTDKRSLLGKLRKQYGEVALLEAIYETEREQPLDPLEYLIGCCKQRSKDDGRSHSRAVNILRQAALDAEQSQGGSGDPEASCGPAWGAEELGDGGATLHRLPIRYSA